MVLLSLLLTLWLIMIDEKDEGKGWQLVQHRILLSRDNCLMLSRPYNTASIIIHVQFWLKLKAGAINSIIMCNNICNEMILQNISLLADVSTSPITVLIMNPLLKLMTSTDTSIMNTKRLHFLQLIEHDVNEQLRPAPLISSTPCTAHIHVYIDNDTWTCRMQSNI